jgi:hypothetical protein
MSGLPGSLAFSSAAIGYSDCPMNNRMGVAISIVPGVGGHIERNSETIPKFVQRCRPERICFANCGRTAELFADGPASSERIADPAAKCFNLLAAETVEQQRGNTGSGP